MPNQHTARIADDFWSACDRSGGPDACWPWKRAINVNGYGSVSVDGKILTASRHAYELANGLIPHGDGYHGNVVMHKCDNRRCVNPSHLVLGTQGQNNEDRDRKERGWWHKHDFADPPFHAPDAPR